MQGSYRDMHTSQQQRTSLPSPTSLLLDPKDPSIGWSAGADPGDQGAGGDARGPGGDQPAARQRPGPRALAAAPAAARQGLPPQAALAARGVHCQDMSSIIYALKLE